MRLRHLNLRVRDVALCREFYQQHFGFHPAFEAEGGFFLRDGDGFLLALLPSPDHPPLPDGFHIGFVADTPDAVVARHRALNGAGVRTSDVEDLRPNEDYVSFRCWDPDGTEIEVFWDGV